MEAEGIAATPRSTPGAVGSEEQLEAQLLSEAGAPCAASRTATPSASTGGTPGAASTTAQRLAGGAALLVVAALAFAAVAELVRGGPTASTAASPLEPLGLTEGKPPVSGWIKNRVTGLCLDWGSVVVANVPCNETSDIQKWGYVHWSRRVMTNDFRCLDSGGKYLHVWECKTGEVGQRWDFQDTMGRLTQVMPDSLLCMEATSSSVTLQPCDSSSAAQKWDWANFDHLSTTAVPSIEHPAPVPSPSVPAVTRTPATTEAPSRTPAAGSSGIDILGVHIPNPFR